jgi:hypothetical protein
MRYSGLLLASSCIVGLGAAVTLAPVAAQTGASGTAVYWMTADTLSGMGGMSAGGGMGSIMGAMLRGGRPNPNAYVHSLRLELGSPRRATGEPTADHLPPAGLNAGPDLPLVTPRVEPVEPGPVEPWRQGNMERPKGRMLLYWGCGDHARPGQPFILDFATLGTTGRMPPEMMPLQVRTETPPSQSRFATYGVWPNEKSKTQVPSNGSLVGDHVVRGNYSPEIRFTLAPGQDFLAPVVLTSNSVGPVGSVPLVWNPVSGARGWLLMSMGSGGNGDFVIWTSSETRMGMSAFDYLPDSEIQRLVTQRVLLPGTADRCTVPAEVKNAMQQGMLTVTAFGGQTNLSYPARPARAPASWRPDWTMKLRTKAAYTGLLGTSMEEMMGGRGGDDDSRGNQGDQPGKKKKKKSLFPGLGGLIPHP